MLEMLLLLRSKKCHRWRKLHRPISTRRMCRNERPGLRTWISTTCPMRGCCSHRLGEPHRGRLLMDNSEYIRRLEFLFVDLLEHTSNNLSTNDLTSAIPILEKCAENNFSASYLLALYWDPNGLVFKNRQCTPSIEKCKFYLEHAILLARNEKSEITRANNIIKAITS